MIQYGPATASDTGGGLKSVPTMAGVLVLAAVAFLVASSILFKGSVHF